MFVTDTTMRHKPATCNPQVIKQRQSKAISCVAVRCYIAKPYANKLYKGQAILHCWHIHIVLCGCCWHLCWSSWCATGQQMFYGEMQWFTMTAIITGKPLYVMALNLGKGQRNRAGWDTTIGFGLFIICFPSFWSTPGQLSKKHLIDFCFFTHLLKERMISYLKL